MRHRVDPNWDADELAENLNLAVDAIRYYRRMQHFRPLTPREEKRLSAWREFEDELRDRITVVVITPALDALEARS